MAGNGALGTRIDRAVARHVETQPPTARSLPRHVAPLPEWLENVGLRLVWLLVAVNLVGTAFGFWYYGPPLSETPLYMWPIVPVSPLATLYMALSLSLWRLGYAGPVTQLVHVLAFVGCLKYGLWSVYVQLFIEGPTYLHLLLWQFLIWSHVGMVIQAFLVQRYATFSLPAIGVAAAWYATNDLFDFFLTVGDGPHHTWLNAFWVNGFDRSIPAYEYMAAGAVAATILTVALAILTRRAVRKRETAV